MSTTERNLGLLRILVLAAILLVGVPLVLDPYTVNEAGKFLGLAFVALGLVLAWGYGGILSLGQGMFFGMGGYVMAMYLKLEASGASVPDFMGWTGISKLPLAWEPFHSMAITLITILVVPGILAFVFSYLVFKKRVGGVYFAIVTMAMTLTTTVLIIGNSGYTGGANGITNFSTFHGMDITSDPAKVHIYLIEAAILTALMLVAYFVRCSRYGKILVAIRDNEDRVRFSGYDTAYYKAFVFGLAALFSAVGGAFFTLQAGLISTTDIGVVASVEMVIYAAVGGRLSVPGAVVGTLLIGFLKTYLSNSFPEIWLYFLGGVFIFVVLALPNGLASLSFRLPRAMWLARQTSRSNSPEGTA